MKHFFSHVSFYRIIAFYWFLLYTHKMENLSCAQQIARAWFWPLLRQIPSCGCIGVRWTSLFFTVFVYLRTQWVVVKGFHLLLYSITLRTVTLYHLKLCTYMYFRKVTEEQLALSLYSEEATTPRYVLTIVDSDIKSNKAFAIFIVPQGRYSHFTCFPSSSLPFLVNILCKYLLFLYLLLKELEEKEVWQCCLHL